MDIVINTTFIDRFFSLPPEQMFFAFFLNFGWIIIGIFFIEGVLQLYLFYIRNKWSETHRNILLAIDIPKLNEQSPKAVENMFTYLGGAHGSVNFFEKWFEGKYQKSFSYEVISLEGYTQFLIRTPLEFRNLIESSVYSQYPDAEISAVDDYTEAVPQRYPDEEYDVWGLEFTQGAPWVYPIKCYKEFEHQMGPSEMQFKDPMATLMDLCGSLRQGEQFWMQYIVIPIGFDWVKESEKEIDKILGRKAKTTKSWIMKGVEALGEASEIVYSIWGDIESKEKEERSRTMMDLTPLEKRRIEGVHEKLSKLSFAVKVRVVYVAKKDVMNKAKVANGVVGYMKQFAALDLNNLKPELKKTMTKTVYFLRESRLNVKKNNIFQAYINRSDGRGLNPGILNIEELATIWHFPVDGSVRASLMQKSPGKKADAPSSLPLFTELTTPTDDFFKTDIFNNELGMAGADNSQNNNQVNVNSLVGSSIMPVDKEDSSANKPPENLPFV